MLLCECIESLSTSVSPSYLGIIFFGETCFCFRFLLLLLSCFCWGWDIHKETKRRKEVFSDWKWCGQDVFQNVFVISVSGEFRILGEKVGTCPITPWYANHFCWGGTQTQFRAFLLSFVYLMPYRVLHLDSPLFYQLRFLITLGDLET